jgi:hypothetical protein
MKTAVAVTPPRWRGPRLTDGTSRETPPRWKPQPIEPSRARALRATLTDSQLLEQYLHAIGLGSLWPHEEEAP